jgi:hypothetical protein
MELSWIWSAVLVFQTVAGLVTVILLWEGRRITRRLLREQHEGISSVKRTTPARR